MLPVLVVLVCSQVVGLVWIAGVALIAQDPVPGGREIVLAAVSALAGTAGLVCFFRAIAIGKMSLVVPIAATAAVVPVVVGIATGDRPGPLQLIGMGVGSLYPVITVLLARLFLHERVHRIQEAGVVAALGGVVPIAAG